MCIRDRDNPTQEKPTLEKPTLENPTQLNKDIQRTDLPKKEDVYKRQIKHGFLNDGRVMVGNDVP